MTHLLCLERRWCGCIVSLPYGQLLNIAHGVEAAPQEPTAKITGHPGLSRQMNLISYHGRSTRVA